MDLKHNDTSSSKSFLKMLKIINKKGIQAPQGQSCSEISSREGHIAKTDLGIFLSHFFFFKDLRFFLKNYDHCKMCTDVFRRYFF